ncbi:MAG TPA: glycosyltransferase family 2 protein [Flavipsychrobacter sp.]
MDGNRQLSMLRPCYTATVSVVISTYNRANLLDRCINSVLQQSVKEWELIIADDGSSDHTYEVVNKYIALYPNIKYIKTTNVGQALARNTGLLLSTGEYVTFLDSDDTYKPEHLYSRIAFMQANPALDVIHGGIELNEDILVPDYCNAGRMISLKECIISGGLFGKRHVFLDLNGFNNQRYGEDTELWTRASRKYNTLLITEPETYIYTRAEYSVSKANTELLQHTDITFITPVN